MVIRNDLAVVSFYFFGLFNFFFCLNILINYDFVTVCASIERNVVLLIILGQNMIKKSSQ